MDYQTYAFVLLTNSDLRGLEFQCGADGCPYPSTIGPDEVSGYDVLRALDIDGIHYGTYGKSELESLESRSSHFIASKAGILVGIAAFYRFA